MTARESAGASAGEPDVERDVAIGALALDCGVTLDHVVQHVCVYGTPRTDGANVVLVAHALTGSARVLEWWGGLVGPGKLLDTNVLCIVGINALGGCYGSTGPDSIASDGRPYGDRFPVITVGDMVRAQRAALRLLGIERVAAVVGGSLGGMQALQWALDAPERVGHAVVIGAYDHFTAMGIALNAIAREAIRIARTPAEGIALARKIAMLTYKSEALLGKRYARAFDRSGGDPTKHANDRFDVEGYLDHQGAIFAARMTNGAYLALTRAMDLYDVRERAPQRDVRFTFAGISSDWLFLPQYVEATARRLANAGVDSAYFELLSDHGHDAFLAEPERLHELLGARLQPLYEALRRPAAIASGPNS